jgi:hypothetical protein
MQAKVGVLRIMTNSGGVFDPEPNEELYVRFFAVEIESYFQAEGRAQ